MHDTDIDFICVYTHTRVPVLLRTNEIQLETSQIYRYSEERAINFDNGSAICPACRYMQYHGIIYINSNKLIIRAINRALIKRIILMLSQVKPP